MGGVKGAARWIYAKNGEASYYQEGADIYSQSGSYDFYLSGDWWHSAKTGEAEYYVSGGWVYSKSGEASFYYEDAT